MENWSEPEHINIGWGRDISIGELAQTVADVVGFEGALEFDTSKPDGTPRKMLDTTRLSALGGLRRSSSATGWPRPGTGIWGRWPRRMASVVERRRVALRQVGP